MSGPCTKGRGSEKAAKRREDYNGLRELDMGCINSYRRKLDAKRAQLLHKIMAGAIWTSSMKFKANVAEEDTCPFVLERHHIPYVVGMPSRGRSTQGHCPD